MSDESSTAAEEVTDFVIDISQPETALDAAREHCADGEYGDAIELIELALARFAGQLDNVLEGRFQNVLASASQCTGDAERAVVAADAAIAALTRGPHSDAAELGVALHSRALTHLHHGGIEEATPLLDRAAQALDGAGARSRIDFLSVLLTMAEVASASGATDEALALCKRCIDEITAMEPMSEEHAAQLNRLTGRAFLGLGGAYAQRGTFDVAKDFVARGVEFFDAGYGHGHPEMTAALQEVAAIYRALGDEDAAAAIEEELTVTANNRIDSSDDDADASDDDADASDDDADASDDDADASDDDADALLGRRSQS